MLVKAKWNVRDASGWHLTGEVFRTEEDLKDAVVVLDAQKKEPVKEAPVPAEEPKKETAENKPKSVSRRKKVSE